jgi:hypothetical protein
MNRVIKVRVSEYKRFFLNSGTHTHCEYWPMYGVDSGASSGRGHPMMTEMPNHIVDSKSICKCCTDGSKYYWV